MKKLELIFTRDMPMIGTELVFNGYGQFKKIFNVPFAETIFIFRAGAVGLYRDMDYLLVELPEKVVKSVCDNSIDLNAVFERHASIVAEIEKIKTHRSGTIKEQLDIINSLGSVGFFGMLLSLWIPNWSKQSLDLFNDDIIKKAVAVREKDAVFDDCMSLYYSVLEQIAQEKEVTVSLLKYFSYEELCAFLESDKIPKDITHRKKSTRYYVRGVFYEIGDAQEKLSSIGYGIHEEIVESGSEVKGNVAFEGKVTSKVCIVHSREDISKFKKGDVLVAPMTTPWYLPLMKDASAFVTDEGGIMCHAAIVSREMKKPCIIGTKIATKVLKDDMMVEVDADRGIVRIIKNN